MSISPITKPRAGTEKFYDDLGQAFDRQNRRKRMSDYDEDQQYRGSGQIFNGSTKLISWLMGINAVLIAAAILGGVNFALTTSTRMATLEAKMDLVLQGHYK